MSYTLIASATSTSNFSTFDFQSISSSYTDLMLVISASSSSGAGSYERINLALNGESLSSQSNVIWGRGYAEGVVASPPNVDVVGVINIGWIPQGSSDQFTTVYVYIPSYAQTQSNRQLFAKAAGGRTVTVTGSATNAYGWSGGLKNASTAISRVTVGTESGTTLRAYSYASLYGITKGGSGSVTPS
jgi:hypothetical protein